MNRNNVYKNFLKLITDYVKNNIPNDISNDYKVITTKDENNEKLVIVINNKINEPVFYELSLRRRGPPPSYLAGK